VGLDELLFFTGIIRDIGSCKQVEQELRQTQRWMLSASSPEALRTISITADRHLDTASWSSEAPPDDRCRDYYRRDPESRNERCFDADETAAGIQPCRYCALRDGSERGSRTRSRTLKGVIGEGIELDCCYPNLGPVRRTEARSSRSGESRGQRA
jgi:hypothetical protein